MSTPQLSARRIELAAICSGAFAHEHVETTNEAAERGSAVHDYIALLLDGEKPTLPKDEKAAALCAMLDTHELSRVARPTLQSTLYTEQALYLLPASGEAATLDGAYHRDYSGAPEGALAGTADVIAVEDDSVTVTDWKTGRSEVPHPAENYQLRFLGLAAAKSFGKDRANVTLCYIRDDGSLQARSHGMETEELNEAEGELRRIAESVEAARNGEPVYKPGSVCRYCPAIASCPAIAGAAQAILEGPAEELTPAKAAESWNQLQAVEAAAKRVRESLQQYVYARPIPTTEGKQLKVVETRRENIDSSKAFAILRDRLPDEALSEAVSVTKTSLSGALSKEVQKQLIAEFKEAGAVEESYSESLREVRG